MEKGKFYLLEIKGWKETIYGIVEATSSEWILIKWIISDYIFDGYSIIRRKYIKKCTQNKETLFREEVLRAKGIINMSVPHIPIDSKTAPFEWFNKNESVVLISPIDESVCNVGKITKVLKIIFYLRTMDDKGTWDIIDDNYLINDVVAISFDTDYVNSLLIYNKKICGIKNNLVFEAISK